MPLIGKHAESGERINILTVPDPRNTFRRGEVLCPLCGEPFYIADGFIKKPYFSHYTDGECSSRYHKKPESPEHRFFKAYLSSELAKHIGEYSKAQPKLEYPVEEILRVADVMFEFSGGWLVAHEIQLSSITVEEIKERTDDYRKVGIDVYWWLGGSGNSKAIQDWCHREYSGCFILDYDKASELIALHEALREATG